MQVRYLIFILLFALKSFAQGGTFGKNPIINDENFEKKKIHFGYYLGFSSYNYQFNYKTVGKDIELKPATGFNVGLVVNLRLREFFDLRFEPGFSRWSCIKSECISSTLNLGSNEKATDDNSANRFRVKTWTQNYEVGFGLDLYLEYFKFSPSIRGVFGTGDELIRDVDPNSPWTGNIKSMQTRAVFVNFTFH